MNQDSDLFCPNCDNLFIRCACGTKEGREKQETERRIIRKSVDFFQYIPKKFEFQYRSEIEGFRGYYVFYESKEKIFSFCNDIMSIPSGVLDKEVVGELSLEYLDQEIKHPTLKTKIAKMFFPDLSDSQAGYALQNVFLFLASMKLARAKREGHGLKFKVVRDYWPEDYQPRAFKNTLKYIGSTEGYRKTSVYHLYESKNNYHVFSNTKYNLITGTLKKKTVHQIFNDYYMDEIDRVTTRITEAKKYFPNTSQDQVGFQFQTAFYALTILGKARKAKVGRTIIFDIVEKATT